MIVEADYVTEREAAAIRGMTFGGWHEDICNMTIVFDYGDGRFSVPVNTVQRYMTDWENSGLWSLPGTKEQTA